ncbi:MAG: ComEC/Rec2 family competence protein, partial [Candidatus Caldatribacteriota bacterium]|nr:ComEC/Rec2 family competence protein [Candidatus Caldatribacteriota bacterium]
ITIFTIILVNIIFPEDDLKVHYINVGEGDCIFIQTPNHFNILIDGGGSPRSEFDVGENIVIPYLRRIGVHDIDVLMLSHAHLDHLEGLLPVMKEFDVDMVMDNRINCDIPKYKEFLLIIDEKEIPYHHTVAGDYFKINRFMEMLILNPFSSKEKINDDADLNNNSIVLKLFYKNTNFLFTGDVEEEAEIIMLSWGNILKSDVLKVGHHGSSTSTNLNFLNKVNPVIAVISTGKNNFGHPSDKVINRLENKDIKVFRTDLNGTVVIETDGDDYFVKTSRRY